MNISTRRPFAWRRRFLVRPHFIKTTTTTTTRPDGPTGQPECAREPPNLSYQINLIVSARQAAPRRSLWLAASQAKCYFKSLLSCGQLVWLGVGVGVAAGRPSSSKCNLLGRRLAPMQPELDHTRLASYLEHSLSLSLSLWWLWPSIRQTFI